MSDDEQRERARGVLARFLPRAMEDGMLDEVEKRQLMGILTSGVLGKDDVQGIFRDYLVQLHGEVWADGRLTADEQARLRRVVTELRIPAGFLPPEIASILG